MTFPRHALVLSLFGALAAAAACNGQIGDSHGSGGSSGTIMPDAQGNLPYVAPQAVGAVGGVMNTTGNFAGLFGPTVAGFILQETGNWIALFYVAAGVALISSLILTLLVRTEPIRLTGLDPLAEGRQAEAGAGLSH